MKSRAVVYVGGSAGEYNAELVAGVGYLEGER
jgi:hypothetical protein